MACLMSQVKGGFYAAAPEAVAAVMERIRPPAASESVILNPCAGNGKALIHSPHTKGKSMKQSLLNRAVARATGESLATIRRMGFSLVDPTAAQDDFDALPKPRTVNWDRLDAGRPAYLPQRSRLRRMSA